jgi:hypothetical protein
MMPMQPRSAGTLQIGSVIYDPKNQVFSVEFLFVAANHFSPEDEIRSGSEHAARYFQKLLAEHGYHDHGPPETHIKSSAPGRVLFYIACKAKKQKPAIIMLREPNAPMKDDAKADESGIAVGANGRDPTDDKA